MSPRRPDVAWCEARAARGAQGDGMACRELVEHLWPHWIELLRSQRSLGPLARSEDHVHNVALRMVAKLSDPASPGIAQYPAWREHNPEKTFEDWTHILLANLVRDYVREELGPRTPNSDLPSVKRLLNELSWSPVAEEIGIRPPFTAHQTARQLVEFARNRLLEPQVRALSLWLEGASFEELDGLLGLPAGQGRKHLRAAVAALRRHFGGESSGGGGGADSGS